MKKKSLTKILVVCITALACIACTKDEIETYNGKDQIYFQWAVDGNDEFGRNLVDSLSYTFAFEIPSVIQKIYNVPVKIQGPLVGYDRAFEVKVSEESGAQQGVHFTMPDNFIIPANENIGYVPLTLNRTADMGEEILSLKLELLSNENFEADLYGTANSSNANRELSYNTFELTISDILVKPATWDGFVEGRLGEYSEKKFYLFAEVNNMPVPNWDVDGINLAEFQAQKDVFKAYLAAQAAAGTPVLEDDGTVMELGPFA